MPVYDINGTAKYEAFSKDGDLLVQAYDINGNELLGIIVYDDSSSGTSTGYSLTSGDTDKQYTMQRVVDLMQLAAGNSLQSFGYDYDNGNYYKFDASTTVYIFNSGIELTGSATLPSSAGHTNDSCYCNGKFYLPGGYMGASVAEGNKLYVWDIANNTVSTITVSGITQPLNGSTRNIWGVCQTERGSGKLYLACIDVTSSELVHDADDKLAIYEYDLSSGVCTLKAEFPWDCVYVQGAACFGGVLYVACNTQTTGAASNYKGITIKCIRTDAWELFDELTVSGTFEPQGMDVFPAGNGYELSTGMSHYGTMLQIARFTIPYVLRSS